MDHPLTMLLKYSNTSKTHSILKIQNWDDSAKYLYLQKRKTHILLQMAITQDDASGPVENFNYSPDSDRNLQGQLFSPKFIINYDSRIPGDRLSSVGLYLIQFRELENMLSSVLFPRPISWQHIS